MEHKFIDYGLIGKAVDYYCNCNYFTLVDVPWTATVQAIEMTYDGYYSNQILKNTEPTKVLIGSAEQSFCDLMRNCKLNVSKDYVAVSPCFRNEHLFDLTHQPQFMKVEMFRVIGFDGNSGREALYYLSYFANKALDFFNSALLEDGNLSKATPIKTSPTSLDIVLNGVEIGSYSSKESDGFVWVCGTGLAEPRFSIAKSKM